MRVERETETTITELREIETLARASGNWVGPMMIASLAARIRERVEEQVPG